MDEIANRLIGNQKIEDFPKSKKEVSNVSVSAMAEILVSKLKGDVLPPPDPIKRVVSSYGHYSYIKNIQSVSASYIYIFI